MGWGEGVCLLGAYSVELPPNQEGPGSVLADAATKLRSEDGSAFSRDRMATLRRRLCYCPRFLAEVAAALTGQMTPINDVEGTCLHGIWTQSQHQNISSVPDSARRAASGHGEDMGVAGRKKCDITHYIYAWLGHMHRDREEHMGPPGSRHLGNRELQETIDTAELPEGTAGSNSIANSWNALRPLKER